MAEGQEMMEREIHRAPNHSAEQAVLTRLQENTGNEPLNPRLALQQILTARKNDVMELDKKKPGELAKARSLEATALDIFVGLPIENEKAFQELLKFCASQKERWTQQSNVHQENPQPAFNKELFTKLEEEVSGYHKPKLSEFPEGQI